MRKNKQNTNPCPQQRDDRSYHTGPAQPPKRGNGLMVALLVAVIFLGGMASAMGIINFRLISMMDRRSDPMTPLASADVNTPTPTALWGETEDLAPSIPQWQEKDLQLYSHISTASNYQVFGRNAKSLVSVYCVNGINETISGTGVVLTEDGYILTNAHIVEGATRIFVHLPDGQLLRAATVGSDAFTDLAVLYVQAEDLIPAIFAAAELQTESQEVYALAMQPDTEENSMLSGTICGLQTLSTGDLSVEILRSSLDGTTGPVFNNQGQIVAIQAGKIRQYFTDSACGSDGLAIPTETVETVVEALMKTGYVEDRPSLGFQVQAISALYQHYWDLPGGLLVTTNGQTMQGLQDGDILLTLNGVSLTSRADLYTTLYTCNVGDELTATVLRDGQTFTATITVQDSNGQ